MNILHCSNSSSNPAQQLGPYRIESLIPLDEEGRLTAYRVQIEAGQVTSESYHKIAEECYYVLEGGGVAYLDSVEHPLVVGDFLRLPPGTRHRFVTGPEGLVMLNLHAPGSRPDRDVYFTGAVPDGFSTGG